jgi:DNA-binding SARP family transcriptional activator/TolB-like protein
MIEFRALGSLILRTSNGQDIHSVLAQPKRVALLAYLAIARPPRFHRRDTLLALLWPDQDDQHARWALNQALRHLRNELGKEVVCSRGDGEVGVNREQLSCDAVEFEAAIESDEPALALGLYRGDLLDGFHVSGCGEFERWLEEERTWLKRRAARAASAVARREEARGEPVAAGHWARRAFALSPDDEGEARSLIELLGRIGDRAGAVQAYEEFARRLQQDYEVEPAPETRALIAAVRSRQHSARGPNGAAVEAPGVIPQSSERSQVSPDFIHAAGNGASAQASTAPLISEVRFNRRKLLTLGALLFAAIAAAAWGLRPPPAGRVVPADRSATIAVLPFAYRGSPEYAYLGEGMVDLLSANLNGAGEIRTVDPHTVLALARQGGGGTSEPEQAGKLSARLRAGSFVLGDVVEAGGRLRISGRLYNAPPGGGVPISATVQGAPEQLFQLVDELTAQLIAGRSGGPTEGLIRLAALTTDSLAALKAYLEGERHFRAGRQDSTVQALDRAIRIDSSFALAHYRMATAAMWTHRRPRASEAADRALRLAHRLSDRDRRLIGAFAASLRGHIPEAERTYREIASRYPDDVEANYQLGDLIFHRHAILEHSWLDARNWFERVLAVDSGYQSALYHLSNIAAREHRLEELGSLTTHVLQIVPPPAWGFRGQRAIAFRDTAEISRFMAAIRNDSDDDAAQTTAGFAVYTTGDLDVGRRLWRLIAEPSRSRGVRLLAHLTLAKMELMTGRWRAAQVELDAAGRLDPATALEHRVLLSLWPLLNVPERQLIALRDTLQRWKADPGPSNESSLIAEHSPAHPYLRLYLLGLLDAHLHEPASALEYAAELERQSAGSFAPTFVADLGRVLRSEVARSRGQLNEALSTLDSVSFWTREDLELTGSSPFYSHEYEQFARAELRYETGRYEEALRSFRGIADELFHSGAPAHLRLAQIYERQGKRQKATEHYARFIELWKDCDPELRPLVEHAKQRMAM